jgi:hypothetical protein
MIDDQFTGLGEVSQGTMAAAAVPGVVDCLRPYLIELEFSEPSEVSRWLRDRTAFWSRGASVRALSARFNWPPGTAQESRRAGLRTN